MGFTLKACLLVGIVSVALSHAALAKTIDEDQPGITILIYNSARVSLSDLAHAEQQASVIFRVAGIKAAWLNCSGGGADEACHRPIGPKQFVLHIVARGKVARGTQSADTVFGVAFIGSDGAGAYRDVFYDRVEQTHLDSGVSPARLLGAVAAHEIGHLLLGSHSHSAMGIMAAHWQKEELRRVGMGCLNFSSEEASRMRLRIDKDDQDGEKNGDRVKFASVRGKQLLP